MICSVILLVFFIWIFLSKPENPIIQTGLNLGDPGSLLPTISSLLKRQRIYIFFKSCDNFILLQLTKSSGPESIRRPRFR